MLYARRLALTAVALFAGLALAHGQPAAAPASGFSVLHISDIHVGPHLQRLGKPGAPNGAETIAWVCEQAAQPQSVAADFTAPAPAFALATGDVTEYGVIDDTFDVFEQAFAKLPCRLYALPGNHDNTWTAMYQVLRKKYGGECYSFDQSGCHFIAISSAAPQEPVPCIDAKPRAWLKTDLDRLPANTPVFIALHHPLYSDEFANPAERETLLDFLRDYNVVLFLYGHGHSVDTRDNGGLPGVMGGSTFGKNSGYGLLTVQDNRVRYAYHYLHDPATKDPNAAPAWKSLVDMPLPKAAAPRLFSLAAPSPDTHVKSNTLAVRLTPGKALQDQKITGTIRIDGQEKAKLTNLEPLDVDLGDLPAGAHLLSVTVNLPDKKRDTRTQVFYRDAADVQVLWQQQLPAAVKAAPVLAGNLLIVVRNDGLVTALDKNDGREKWTFKTGGEILGTPAWSDGTLVVGSGDGQVYALDERGQRRWAFDAGFPVYGWPLVVDGTVYIGDNGGRLHALQLADGKPLWKFERADFSIEVQPAVWQNLITFGAWDGYLYAVERSDGKLRWKSFGAKSAKGGAARYYAPADCGPVVLGEQLFVADRGYLLGAFDHAGKITGEWNHKIAAITRAADRKTLLARTTDDHVLRLSATGEPVWSADVPAGRFPIAPTEAAGRIYVCSNRGRLSVLDAQDGHTRWSYQVTPGLFVMAPIAVDTTGPQPVCYVAGMDGTLVALQAK